MDPQALLTLTRWLSPAYPTGGFAWSHGLETLVADGAVADGAGTEAWLRDVLAHGAGRNDAILLCAAWRARDEAELDELSELALALSPGAERQAETREQGAAFARVTGAVDGAGGAARALPVAVGAAARGLGAPIGAILLLYLQNFAANLVAIAVRHVPLGQTEGQAILARLSPLFRDLAAQAEDATLDDLGGCALTSDLASLRHETLRTRIFRS